ncbi:DUF1566 domain-containing protein [Teredinibacter waterburyi]|jgi:Protein of unknown function (DUF1566).|uniref:Lcl C-terminal domain-containing protein n=1 Tax=Teredinibacter waterburyi TaxID=1500538 RepID=UPI001FE48203|nr:DUF1566 domain-containing protein [Teredinibacter waterburyi]
MCVIKTLKIRVALVSVITCLGLAFSGCSKHEATVAEVGEDGAPQTDSTSTMVPLTKVERTKHSRKLNDTGITWGGNYPKDINYECTALVNVDQLPDGETVTGDILAQQDCANGWDKTAGENGLAAYLYKKIGTKGELLADDASSWSCVLDEVTGLVWEVKQDADGEYGKGVLNDADDLFMWYNSNIYNNGGAIGNWNSQFDQCAGYEAGKPTTYCNIEQFAARVNEQGLCGANDWRIPSRPELESLVNFGQTMPAIENAYFRDTKNEFYWSNTPVAGFKGSAWAVSFQFGFSAPLPRDNSRHVRLVRSYVSQ